MTLTIRVLGDLASTAGETDEHKIAAMLKAAGMRDVLLVVDPPTQAMLLAMLELWPGPETGPARASAILDHALQLGLALLCKCNDEPSAYEPPHDGCLDLIDEVRLNCGMPPLGGG